MSNKIAKMLISELVVEPVSVNSMTGDSTQIEQAFLERVRADYISMPHPDFLKKYDLDTF